MAKDRHFVGLPGCERLWSQLGKLQFDYLVNEGLRPSHCLFDVGCGTFRSGWLFIDYLEKGHYFGIDRNPNLLLRGIRAALTKSELILRKPTLYAVELGSEGVNLRGVFGNVRFDYIWVHAVFDHMCPASVKQALIDLSKVLKKQGSIYATAFIVDDGDYDKPSLWGVGNLSVTTYPDREYWHYEKGFFSGAIRDCGLTSVECSDYEHPLGLSMLKFTRSIE